MFDLHDEILKVNVTRPGMPLVMGILNVTPDSFSDGGNYVNQQIIESRVLQMIEEGVDIIDIGGESTRPGAEKVSLEVELQRVIPVIEWIKSRFEIPISIDTYKTEVMAEAISRGVDIVNDVNALQSEGAMQIVAESDVTVCIMHKKGCPEDMQNAPEYGDVVIEVRDFLLDRAQACEAAGISKNKIIIDPGFGFGKTLAHNTQLFNELSDFIELDYPLLVGVSRKRMIGEMLDNAPVEKRLHGSVAAAVLAGMKGASVVRVHDVASTVESLKVISQLV
ncbi:dihydropteroate synthase [Thiomicrorhabdus sp. Kp2]|uniref:dihydropteroate synthase n=1 Tax=Thiomicrorhabdus sp. Kp2 TaxID=1123518 RepID=UPI000423B47A|nr:dihydropteroate synthase [Thiomicrorhabdus sp. Kp2]